MQHQRKLWAFVGLVSALTLSVFTVGSSQSYQMGDSERGDRFASRSYVYQNYSADHFFTQADRDLVTRVRVALEDDSKTRDLARYVTINVNQGRVALQGSIPSERDHEYLTSRVQRTVGVAA